MKEAYPLVQLVWFDAWTDDHEGDPEEWPEDCLVTTVGYLVRKTDKVVSVAAEIVHLPGEPDGFRSVTHVPLQWTNEVNYLQHEAAK